ncbi:copper chaperone PCu(A)C [Castellaniella sp.]|uniref:copper chaperone PCu(A)C n=1 Tax=Castellaniella sp. TaxID=1955812 RepID=UPI002A36D8D3|nr:copper chaperone PCu(A)C [Castellaniella sp.]
MTRTLAISAGMLLAASAWAQDHAPAAASGKVSATVTASDCWIRMIPPPAPSGGFFVAHNAGSEDAVLTGAHSPDYGMVMLHETTESDGMSKMAMVHQVTIPAGKDLAFKPGSYHVMLEQPREGLKIGDSVQLNLTLANGDTFSTTCEIKSPKAMSGADDHAHMQH